MKVRSVSKIIVFLAILLIFGSTAAFAAFPGNGAGTASNPYIITTAAALNAVRDYPSAYFRLGSDIDLTSYLQSSSTGWTPIRDFSGNFNGAGHEIKGLWINLPEGTDVGLFGSANKAVIENLGIHIDGRGIRGGQHVGGLVGESGSINGFMSGSSIANCYVTGNINGGQSVGGLVGTANDGSSITNCYATGDISGDSSIGGLVGHSGIMGSDTNVSRITNCYATGNVNATGYAGGLVARNNYSRVSNCYAMGDVTGGVDSGALVGINYYPVNLINNYRYEAVRVNGTQPVTNDSNSIHGGIATAATNDPNSIHGGTVTARELNTQTTYSTRTNWSFSVGSAWAWDTKGFPKLNIGTEEYSFPFANAVAPTTFTVTFDSQGGSSVASVTAQSGAKITQPVAPVKDGDMFTGWFRDASATQIWNFATDTVTSDITLYAGWEPESPIPAIMVTFDSNGGSSVERVYLQSGDKITQPVDPTRTGYTFTGWFRDASATQRWNFAADTVTDDITLYAGWSTSGGDDVPGDGGGGCNAVGFWYYALLLVGAAAVRKVK